MQAFLLYICDHALSGRAGRIKEQSIGADVLGRKPDYNPADDNIVRVRARELRERLGKYFATEGIEEPIVITVPKGTYVPEFSPRFGAPHDAPVVPRAIKGPDTTSQERHPLITPQERHPLIRYWAPLMAFFLITVVTSIALTRILLKSGKNSPVVQRNVELQDFWGQFFDRPDEELRVVYADSGLGAWQTAGGHDLHLGDYLSQKYLGVRNDKFSELVKTRVTSPADLSISVQLAILAKEFGGRIRLQFARDNDDFFRYKNAFVIGSRRSNPWVEVFEPHLNFVLDKDPHSGALLFRNRHPQAHEADAYAIPTLLDAVGRNQKEFDSYGLVALLKGCTGPELVVLAEGLNMPATQAAGDMLTDPQRLQTMLSALGHKTGTKVTPFEALIKLTSLPGGYENPTVITFRLHPAGSCEVW